MTKKRKSVSRISRDERLRERTEKVAYELYQNRLLLKRQGDALKDWMTAEEIVQSPLKAVLFAINRAFIKLEKRTWEPLLAWANNQALLSLLGLIGNAGIIIAVLTYVGSEKQRRDAEVLNAWQTITSAHGQAGSGGRIQALEFLNASPGANWRRRFPWFCAPLPLCTWPAESLDGVNLTIGSDNSSPPDEQSTPSDGDRTIPSPARVYLAKIQLPGASLIYANLERANLQGANLERAYLLGANLEEAILRDANLEGADLLGANLEGARLRNANLEGADLFLANLKGAYLSEANLEEANLQGANLEGAILWNANLERADLQGANLEGASLFDANLEGAYLGGVNLEGADLGGVNLEEAWLDDANLERARNLTKDLLAQAKLCRTKLPEGIPLNPNRDCEEMGIDPETGGRVAPPDN